MKLELDHLRKIAGEASSAHVANMTSIVVAVNSTAAMSGLDRPHRLAHFLAQVAHESGRFRYDREVWGPTPAQKRYEGRKDLGNDEAGDGSLFRGRGPIQVTGRANVEEFEEWCNDLDLGPVPDFSKTPDAINTDPWEGLSAVWYWTTRNLNRYADEASCNIEMVTRRINGGVNGLEDRIQLYVRAALVLLGYDLQTDGVVERFQQDVGEKVDGTAGPDTRKAMQRMLVARGGSASVVATERVEKTKSILAEIRTHPVAPMPTGAGAAPSEPIVVTTPKPTASTTNQTIGDLILALIAAIFGRKRST